MIQAVIALGCGFAKVLNPFTQISQEQICVFGIPCEFSASKGARLTTLGIHTVGIVILACPPLCLTLGLIGPPVEVERVQSSVSWVSVLSPPETVFVSMLG